MSTGQLHSTPPGDDLAVNIAVIDTPDGDGRDLSVEMEHFPTHTRIRQVTDHGDPQTLVEACRGVDAVLTVYSDFSREVLEQMPRCKVISVAATGFDCIDLDAAKELGISVCCIDEYCTEEVADHTLSLILSLSRKLEHYRREVQRERNWEFDSTSGLKRLSRTTLGLVGFGRIGQAVAKRASGFGMNILAYDPYRTDYDAGVRLVELDELLRLSDIISLHANLSKGNRKLIDGGAFLKMERKPLLINVSRGALIDEEALVYALDKGLISGAGLDVLSDEPPKLDQHPLLDRENVIITPHVAFYSDQSILENRKLSAQNIKHYLAGRFDDVKRLVHHAQSH